MTNIGPTPKHAGCPEVASSLAPVTAYPRPGFTVGGGGSGAAAAFGSLVANRSTSTPAPSAERFVSSQTGGVIVGADGIPAGTVPAGSFVDTKDGTVYGANGTAIALPAGATVDFFDLPELAALMAASTAAAATEAAPVAAGGGSPTPPMKAKVDGQWGPGGVTAMKGGETCEMDHGPTATKAGGATSTGTLAALNPATTSGGLATGVAGANGLGTVPTLESSIAELVKTLRELTMAMSQRTTAGGAPGQSSAQVPLSRPSTTTTPS